ncbi:MAG: ornithine cyclodeaminase, partial [Actinobacteria bacterium]|nr:ornithine cyclodeaminase [Actinomycetota bacterium]
AYLSALRTAAYTALSVRHLAIPEVRHIAVIGCGALAAAHVPLLAIECPSATFVMHDIDAARLEAAVLSFSSEVSCRPARSAQEAIADAQVIVTTTTVTNSYLCWGWLAPGALVAHVSLDDVEPEVVQRADLVLVDDWPLVSSDRRRLLGRMYHAGELLAPDGSAGAPPHLDARRVDGSLSDVLAGTITGRVSPHEVVLSNPFGMGILDLALATKVLEVAEREELGVLLDR